MAYRFNLSPVGSDLDAVIIDKLNRKTKPPGSLGQLEQLAARIARIQRSLTPRLPCLHHIVFAADHGVCAQGVSAYPGEVTRQMVLNFIHGGAAINVFCRQHGVPLSVVDAGLRGAPLPAHPALTQARIRPGSADFSQTAAMTGDELAQALDVGGGIARRHLAEGASVLSFGEMGIGNSTSAAALMAACLSQPAQLCVGRGTGADPAKVAHKVEVVRRALALHAPHLTDGQAIMRHLGGLELAMMAGAMAATAERGTPFIVDGFIASAALLTVWRDQPEILDYALFSHESDERGHRAMLAHLNARPLLHLDLRLGEGTGAVLAWPLFQSALAFFNDMASFAEAGVSQSDTDDSEDPGGGSLC